MPTNVRPPYDAELAAALALVNDQLPSTITPDMIEAMRSAPVTAPIEEVLEGRNISHREVTIPGYEGFGVTVSIFARNGHESGPGIYHTHGGGMIIGDRFTGMEVPLEWVERFGASVRLGRVPPRAGVSRPVPDRGLLRRPGLDRRARR